MRYFVDCEFDGYGGRLLSLALVSDDGRELYLAAHPDGELLQPWVFDHVVPAITVEGAAPEWCAPNDFGPRVAEYFAADTASPWVIADWPDDIRYLCAVLITGPGEMVNTHPRVDFSVRRVDVYPTGLAGAVQHNALWDARALRFALSDPGAMLARLGLKLPA
jgi:hypothetical protein